MAGGSVIGEGILPPGTHYAYFGGQGDVVRGGMSGIDTNWVMEQLTQLTDAHLELSKALDRQFNMAATTLLLKVKTVVTRTGGVARDFIEDLVGVAIRFFQEAEKYEAKINSPDTMVSRVTLLF